MNLALLVERLRREDAVGDEGGPGEEAPWPLVSLVIVVAPIMTEVMVTIA